METRIKVIVSTCHDSDLAIARVRKTILNDAGDKVISKSVLLSDGEWFEMQDREMWPENSTVEVSIHEVEIGEHALD